MYKHHNRRFFQSALDRAEHTLAASYVAGLINNSEEDVEHGIQSALGVVEHHARSFTMDSFKDDPEVQAAIAEEKASSKVTAKKKVADKKTATKKPASAA